MTNKTKQKMFFNTQNENAIKATYLFVQSSKIKATRTTITKLMYNHIDYPSFNAICDTLKFLNIDSYAIEITKQQLLEVPTPCLAALKIENGIFVVINDIKDGFVEWRHTEKGRQCESIDSFTKKWRGIIIIAQKRADSGEKYYTKNRHLENLISFFKVILVIGFIFILFISIYLTLESININFSLISIIIVKLLGITISSILLWYLLDKENPFIKSICQIGKSSNCDSVLNSKAASINGIISWSEIGFFYFAGTLLLLLLGVYSNNIVSILILFNLLALPYTLFSLYYQYFVVKKWCVLCLAVQAILWIEFIIFSLAGYLRFSSYITTKELLILCFSLCSPIVFWFIIKSILSLSIQVPTLKNKLRVFQNNLNIYNQLLTEQEKLVIIPNFKGFIEHGNPEAINIITLVTDPYCNVCSKQHAIIESILQENLEILKIQNIFFATNHIEDKRGNFVRHLFSLKEEIQSTAIDKWFRLEEKDFDIWKSFYPINNIDETAFKKVEENFKWCMNNRIRSTPTIYINGYKLPEVYTIEDFKRISKYYFAQNNVGNKAASINA